MRGVWFFLLFVLALAGWGMYFYSASKELDVVDYDMYAEEEESVVNAVAEDVQRKEELIANKEHMLKENQARLSSLEQEKARLEKEYKELLGRVDSLQNQYNDLKKKSESTFSEIRQKDELITEYKKEKARLKKENEKLTVEIKALKGESDALKSQNKLLKDNLAKMQAQTQDINFLKKALRRAKHIFIEKKKEQQRKKDMELLKKGNKGFVVFGGKNTLRRDVEILVIPADKK